MSLRCKWSSLFRPQAGAGTAARGLFRWVILSVILILIIVCPACARPMAWSAMTSGTKYPLWGVWSSSPSNVFVVGDSGTILHYDGRNWSIMTSGTGDYISGIWGSSPSDVFAVGNKGIILHYNGMAWSTMTSGTVKSFQRIWGSNATDIFAVAREGIILHYNGKGWSDMPSGTVNDLWDIWGSSSSDVFAAGKAGTILHYDGKKWGIMTSGTTNNIYSIWGKSPSDVFAAGDWGTILHYDGKAWSAMSSGATDVFMHIWGKSSKDVYAVGNYGLIMHYDGRTWSAMFSGIADNLYGIRGNASVDMLAVGDKGTIMHYSPVEAAGTKNSPQDQRSEVVMFLQQINGLRDGYEHNLSDIIKPIDFKDDSRTIAALTATNQLGEAYRLQLDALPVPGGISGLAELKESNIKYVETWRGLFKRLYQAVKDKDLKQIVEIGAQFIQISSDQDYLKFTELQEKLLKKYDIDDFEVDFLQ